MSSLAIETGIGTEEIHLRIGSQIVIGDECVGTIDADDGDRVHITSKTFTGWATKDELREGIASEKAADGR